MALIDPAPAERHHMRFAASRPINCERFRGHGRSRFAEFLEQHALDGPGPATYKSAGKWQANADVQHYCSIPRACSKAHRR
jgi:hypothetical protein